MLNHLAVELPRLGYHKVQVVSGLRTPYPNGAAPIFLAYGFTPVSRLDRLIVINDGCEDDLLLMERVL